MSSTITLALRTAQSGLLVNQQALDSISNNIANVNSPSYSRKIVNVEQRVVGGTGAGVQISDVGRQVDEGLLKSLRLEKTTYNNLDVQTSYYDRLQDLFGNPADNTSIAHIMNSLADSVENLATAPDSSLNQSEMVRQGQEVALKLQDMTSTIQDLRVQADADISSNVDTINQLTSQIADLNDKIIRNNALTSDVSDLRDQRDKALDQLSTLIDIRYFYRSDGDAVVFTSAGRTLVDNEAFSLSHSAASSLTPTSTHAEGDIGGIYIGTAIPGNDITDEVSGGKLGGLITMRDQTLTNLQAQLDEMASTLRDTLNQVHNSGVPYPGLQSMTGTRHFLDTSDAANTRSQSITYSGNDDTRVVLVDGDGNQQASTTIRSIVGSATTTIGNLATQLQTWLQSNGAAGAAVSVDSTGRFTIELNSSSVYLGFRDETSSTAGSTQSDASIGFDADGDGNTDETVSGFSNFLGLNDFFTDGLGRNVHESDVVSTNFTAPADTTLSFVDGTSDLPLSASAVTLNISSGDSLEDIAQAITDNVPNITATVVPEGSGRRLRISHDNGVDFEITETGSGNLLSTLGMHNADTRTASQIDVRSDIIDTPSLISGGALQWDSNLGTAGEYYTSVGDDTTAQSMASTMNSAASFDTAGGLAAYNISFANYGAAVLATNSSQADNNSTQADREKALTQSLQTKSDNIRGVNLDEEMSELIRYQQAYSASARVINVIQNMFDVLNQSVG